MIGCYDFCGHYEFTFAWLDKQGGITLVREYWLEAISLDASKETRALIQKEGFAGMRKYWGHTLKEEAAGYTFSSDEETFRIDMHACPSKGFLLKNGLQQYTDYCDHCLGWIGPLMEDAGFVVDHEHDHQGMCWWEFRKREDPTARSAPGTLGEENDVRLRPQWNRATLDVFRRAVSEREKVRPPTRDSAGDSPASEQA